MLHLIVAFTLAGSIGAILGAVMLLAFPQGVRQKLLPFLVSYAVGTLLGSAFLCLIPTGLEKAAPQPFMATMLAGIIAFFALEKLILQRHSLTHTPEGSGSAGPLLCRRCISQLCRWCRDRCGLHDLGAIGHDRRPRRDCA